MSGRSISLVVKVQRCGYLVDAPQLCEPRALFGGERGGVRRELPRVVAQLVELFGAHVSSAIATSGSDCPTSNAATTPCPISTRPP